MDKISIFCPGTVANVCCGFDIFGFPLNTIGDIMEFKKIEEKQVRISEIYGEKIPKDPNKNLVGHVSHLMLEKIGYPFGVEIRINKLIKPGSGIGSSAANAAGTSFAINKLSGNVWNIADLIEFSMQGERFVSGSAVADNVAPALLGGFVLIRSNDPVEYIEIPSPQDLFSVVLHPQLELKTKELRNVLSTKVLLSEAIQQCANFGSLLIGLSRSDFGLIGKSLEDVLVEPQRWHKIPNYQKVKKAAISSGALGMGISGSGPSMFMFTKGEQKAIEVAKAIGSAFRPSNIKYKTYVSKINKQGIKVIDSFDDQLVK